VLGRLVEFVATRFKLPPAEIERLRVWAALLPRREPSLPALGRRLRTALTEPDREAFALLLGHAVVATVDVTPWEVAALEVAYKALGLKRDALVIALTDLGVQRDVVEVRRAQPGRPGERLPARRPQPVELDEARVRHLLEESQAVSALLGAAMRDAEDVASPPRRHVGKPAPPNAHAEPAGDADARESPTDAALVPSDARFAGLDPRHHGLLAALLERDTWDAAQYEALVREQRLMPASALATINEWAEETLGDLLLEEGDPISVNHDLLGASR
jgi:hypothetical protein